MDVVLNSVEPISGLLNVYAKCLISGSFKECHEKNLDLFIGWTGEV